MFYTSRLVTLLLRTIQCRAKNGWVGCWISSWKYSQLSPSLGLRWGWALQNVLGTTIVGWITEINILLCNTDSQSFAVFWYILFIPLKLFYILCKWTQIAKNIDYWTLKVVTVQSQYGILDVKIKFELVFRTDNHIYYQKSPFHRW